MFKKKEKERKGERERERKNQRQERERGKVLVAQARESEFNSRTQSRAGRPDCNGMIILLTLGDREKVLNR